MIGRASPGRRLLLLGLLALLPACGPAARPSEKPAGAVPIASLAILNLPVRDLPPPVQQDILTTLASRLYRRYRVRVVAGRSLGRGVWGPLDQVARQACRQVRDRLEQARQANKQLRIGKSIELAQQAVGWLSYCGAELADPGTLVGLYTILGRGLLSRDRQEEALAAFRQAVSFDPDRPPPGDLPPGQLQAFEKARRQLLSGNPTRTRIRSEPSGARVFVDGRALGTTPIEDAPLYPGRHFLRLELSGHAPWTMELSGGIPPRQIHAWLMPALEGPPPEALLAGAREESAPGTKARRQLKRIAGSLGVDAVLLVRLTRSEGQIRLASQLFVPATDSAGEWRDLSLGPQPVGLAKKLTAVAGWYPELKRHKAAGKRRQKRKQKTDH